ncbi:hypothetical protein [uncultured Shewanella sp.]|uniref:hypothetical protein n=1 Tax=uncultured Shewanella sp. TaxID=173975 RepID=UPI00261D3E54|nr:hypothetical protein [uncultured Shewanella sp.]
MMNIISKKSVLSVLISLLTVNAYAADTEQSKTVLNVTASQSQLTQSLESHYGSIINSDAADENDTDNINEQVTNADIIYVDLSGVNDNDEVNAYLSQAKKLNKLIVLENMGANTVSELPLSFDADVVIVNPQSSGSDEISTYRIDGSSDIASTSTTASSESNVSDETASAAQLMMSSAVSSELSNEQTQMLEEVNDKIDEYLTPSYKLYSTSTSTSGGDVGYECPSESKDEQLCYSAIVTNNVYSYDDDSLVFNVIHGYSYAAYRTDSGTTMFVSPYGSANPTMKYNSSGSKRGYYLKYVKPEIDVSQDTNAGMTLFKRTPENANGTSSISTTSGVSYSAEAKVSDSASLGGSLSYSESQSQSTDLSDWKAVTTTDGYDANWSYELSKYTSLSDWVSQNVFETAKFASVPDISRYGLQYSAEGVWYGNLNAVSGDFTFTVTEVVGLEYIKFTDNTILSWSAKSTEKYVTLTSGSTSFNTDWLKAL